MHFFKEGKEEGLKKECQQVFFNRLLERVSTLGGLPRLEEVG